MSTGSGNPKTPQVIDSPGANILSKIDPATGNYCTFRASGGDSLFWVLGRNKQMYSWEISARWECKGRIRTFGWGV